MVGVFGWEQGWPLTVGAGALSFAAAVLVLRCIEEPLMRVRAQIRRPRTALVLDEPVPAISD